MSLDNLNHMTKNQDIPARDGVNIFLDASTVSGQNRRSRTLYNIIAPFYDLPYTLYDLITRGGAERVRRDYLNELDIKAGDTVLEVCIGTGVNIRYLNKEASYSGLDISLAMLKKCQKNLNKWGREAHLFLSEAECLPFKENVFDAVFLMGGINFFNDKAQAIREMIRVAKPGTKLLIVDETEMFSGRRYRRTPQIMAPVSLLPPGMEDVRYQDMQGSRLYRMTFRKPSD